MKTGDQKNHGKRRQASDAAVPGADATHVAQGQNDLVAGVPASPPLLAIVGMGCLFPKADGTESFWANIKGGVDAVGEIPASHWKEGEYFDSDASTADMTYAKRGAFLEAVDFDPLAFGITPNNLEAIDTTQLLGLVVAQRALRDAGYATGKDSGDGKNFNRGKTSVILGVTGALEMVIPLGARLGHPKWRKALKDAGVEKSVAEDVVKRIGEQYVPWQENSFPGLLGNVAAGRIANKFDLGGTNCVVDAACASSLSALHMAAMELYAGRAEMAITGGIDTFNDIFMYMCFSKTPALSPTGDARPFAGTGPDGKPGADGTILGEGLGVIVLKRLDDALRDGDNVRAVIRGIGSSSDGKGNAVYAPSSAGQVRCLMSAYGEAGIGPETVELVEAHGTGTKVGDAVEAKALNEVFKAGGKEGTWCALGSVKSMVGHTKAAAGIAGLMKAALALDHKVLPPTIKVERPMEPLEAGKSALYLNTEKRPWVGSEEHPRRAGVSAFGFGGSNFHCVLEEAGPAKTEADWDDSVQVLAFDGETRGEIEEKLRQLPVEEGASGWKKLRAVGAELRAKFKSAAHCRLMMVAQKGVSDVKKMIKGAVQVLGQKHVEGGEKKTWNTPDGTYFGSGVVGKLAAIFPGQGSQYVGMLRDLACQFPEMLETLEEGNKQYGEVQHGQRLSDRIYPVPAFSAEERQGQEKALNDTRVAQPALGVANVGAWKLLMRFGVKAEALAGHSFGELVALCASGRMDRAALHRLAKARGAAMAELAGTAFSGAMLAVMATVAVMQQFIDTQMLDLVIANKNAPDQVVLSGAAKEIDRAVELLEAQAIRSKKLPVSAAFHSPLVAAAEGVLAGALETDRIADAGGGGEGQRVVFANSTGAEYPRDGAAAAAILAGQIARPVEFVKEIEAMYGAGVRTFLEVGPGAKLTGLVRAILKGREFEALAVDASNGKRGGVFDLGCAIAQLAALGHGVDLTAWDGKFAREVPAMRAEEKNKKAGMTVKLTGANYVKARVASAPVAPAQFASVPVPAIAPKVGVVKSIDEPARRPAVFVKEDVVAMDKRADEKLEVPRTGAGNQARGGLGGGAALGSGLAQALEATRAGILALQKMQEKTAELHGQYLRGQEAAQGAIGELMRQQMAMMGGVGNSEFGIQNSKLNKAAMPVVTKTVPVVERAPGMLSGHSDRLSDGEKLSAPLSMAHGVGAVSRAKVVEGPVPKKVAVVAPVAAAVPVEKKNADGTGRVTGVLLEVVAEKTGYPVEMLELGMSLDGDLGIDSIKRVEILSALQTRLPDAPVVKPEDLGRLQTLGEIVEFLGNSEFGIQNSESEVAQIAQVTHAVNSATVGGGEVQAVLLEVVAEKTGYPVEMLELGMSLDGDLGIDSIKRVEILSALQTRLPDAPVVKPEDLGRLQTLGEIVAFLSEGAGVVVGTGGRLNGHSGTGERDESLSAPLSMAHVHDVVDDHDGHANGHEGLDRQVLTVVPLNGERVREKVALAKGAIVWVTEDGAGNGGLSERISGALGAHGLDARVVGLDAVPAVEMMGVLAGLLIVAPQRPKQHFIQDAFHLMQRVGPALRESGKLGAAFLASASSLDGSFGLNGHTPRNPLTGGLAGMVKTASHEWPEVTCKSLDLSRDAQEGNLSAFAEQIADELLLKGPAEVGISAGGRVETLLVRKALNGEVGAPGSIRLTPNDVVVVTGGARGVTAAVSVAIAKSYGCKLLLLGRSAEPGVEAAWLKGLSTEGEIKKAIAGRKEFSSGGAGGLRAVEEAYRKVVADREVRATLTEISAVGVEAAYRSLDVRDTEAVGAALAEARKSMGPIRGIIHGAGVLQDRLIEDKTREQFDAVFSTKVGGFNALLHAVHAAGDDLKVIVAFSSTTGRFGRKGQIAYAAANEVLNKLAQQEAHQRPNCRVIAMNWGPWEGGMVTPALRRVFKDEGVGLIPLKAGAEYLVREMSTPAGGPVEILILGPGSKIETTNGRSGESAHTRGIAGAKAAPMALAFERVVSVETHPVLRSHVIKGKAVAPAALMVEWLAHGAMHENPGLVFQGFDELRIFKGMTLLSGETVTARIMAGGGMLKDSVTRVAMELHSERGLHARAVMILGAAVEKGVASAPPAVEESYAAEGGIYGDGRLFHGEALRGLKKIVGWSAEGIVAEAGAAEAAEGGVRAWMKQPLRSGWVADPLALDCAFQLMILWCFEARGIGSLPTGVARYRQFARAFPKDVRIVIRVDAVGEHAARAGVEFLDNTGGLIARMDGYECVLDATLEGAFAMNELADGRR